MAIHSFNRYNENYTGEITEEKNLDITVKFYPDMLTEIKGNEFYHFTELLWLLDCYVFGEEFSLGNYAVGHKIYNAHSDKLYIYTEADLQKLTDGEEITLSASDPTDADREEWEKWG